MDWFYGQIVGFLGNFFAEMGSMGAELFDMSWVQSVVLFFSYLGWALYAIGLVVSCFETGVEYSAGRGNVKETALNAMKGFLAVSLFTQVPVKLYALAVSLQADLTAGITGYGTRGIGDVAKEALADFDAVESLTTGASSRCSPRSSSAAASCSSKSPWGACICSAYREAMGTASSSGASRSSAYA